MGQIEVLFTLCLTLSLGLVIKNQISFYVKIHCINFATNCKSQKDRQFRNSISTQCLKMTQNVAYVFFLVLAFFTNFCPIKSDLSGNTIRPKSSGFQKLAKIDYFWHF